MGETSRRGDIAIKVLDVEAVRLYPPTYLKRGYIMGIRATNFGDTAVEFPYEAFLIDQGGNRYPEVVYNTAITGKIEPDGGSKYGDIRVWDVPSDVTELTLKITSGDKVWEFRVL